MSVAEPLVAFDCVAFLQSLINCLNPRRIVESKPREPLFQAAQLDDIMREATLALMAVADGHWFPSGTATIIGHGLAVTAKHVVKEYEKRFGRCSVLAANVLEGGKEGALWFVSKCYSSPFTDIALLFLSPVKGSERAENYEWAVCPMMNLEPPDVGSGVWGFGYPNSEVSHLSSGNEKQPSPTIRIKWSDRPSITTGNVIEVYFLSRDSSMMPFPGFQTDARFDHGMSGGPVFNENGELCGIISTGFVFSEDGGPEATFVSSLWPLMGLQLDIPIPGNESIGGYLLADFANAKYIRTLNLNKVVIERTEAGAVNRVGFRK